jgi:sugar phosphate isomerase/epimerase
MLCAHVPFPRLGESLAFLVERRLNPEIFLSAEMLEALVPEQVQAVAAALTANGLTATIHAPFIDLNPGSDEQLLRDATRLRFRQVAEVARIIKPRVMVFHPGYDRWRYGERQESWLRHSIPLWREILDLTADNGCTIAVENIFEEEPSTLVALIEAIDSPRFRHCFDTGHWNLFHKVSMEEWFSQLGPHIVETHIHDNAGTRDDHAPIGDGTIDFGTFFTLLAQYAPDAVWTIEAHSREKLERALHCLAPFI